MSQENVEIVRALLDALNRGDWEAAMKDAVADGEFDWTRALGPYRGTYRPHQMRQLIEEFLHTFESHRFEPEEFIDAGDRVVVPFTGSLRGRDGIEVEARNTWLFTIRNGKIERVCLYQERQEALEAAGLSE